MKKSLNTVIVTYNNHELLNRCISSVLDSLKHTQLESTITVVDNASSDGTEKLVQESFPSINYILNKQNLGLAKALNIGTKLELDRDFTLLLNDDTELFPDTLSLMVQTLDHYPEAKGIQACLIYPDGTPQRVKLKIVGVEKDWSDRIRVTRFAGTTASLYRTEIFKTLGYFDEFYFFYNEDLDFSLRAKRKGIKFIFNPEVKVIHHRKKGRMKAINAIKPYFYATDYYFYRKNYGIIFAFIYLIMAFFHIGLWKKRFKKEKNIENLSLLKEGREKLLHTVRNFRRISGRSGVI